MQVTWHGLNCVRLEGKDATVVMDPFGAETGLKMPRSQADIVTISNDGLDPEAVAGEPFVIDVPGEYECKGVFIYGLPWQTKESKEKHVLYRVNMEDISFAHLGGLDRELSEAALELLEGVDVVFIPAGEGGGLSAKVAVEVINQIDPRIVIPVDFHVSGLKTKVKGAEAFLKELGGSAERVDKVKLVKKDLPTDDRKVYVLENT